MNPVLPPPPEEPQSSAVDDVPAPVMAHEVPPPEAEVYESDVLKRQGRFSWKKFGGDGFMISLAVHVILAVLGLFWVVSSYVAEKAKGDPDVFATGAGGGANGDKAKQFEHKLKSRNMQVKMPSRIVSKNANASVSLPSTPNTSTASFATGLASGGMSKGAGGGSGGGEGAGIGLGKGNGKNFVSFFGSKGGTGTLVGSIYDFFQTNQGKPSKYPQTGPRSNNLKWMTPIVDKFIEGGWDESMLTPFFKGPASLGVTQILIPRSPAEAAPDAFEATGKMVGGAWIVVYRGRVMAPESATIRFLGNADNYIAVRFNRKNLLGYECGKTKCEEVDLGMNRMLMRGPWLSVQKGTAYDIDVLIGDAGGVFSGTLVYEKKEAPKKLFLFRTASTDFEPIILQDADSVRKNGHKPDLPRNLVVDSPVWTCVQQARVVR